MHGDINRNLRISILELEYRLSSLSTGSSVDFEEISERPRASSNASSFSSTSRDSSSLAMEKYPRSLLEEEEEELLNTVDQSLIDLGNRAQTRRRVSRSKSLSLRRKANWAAHVERSFSSGSYDFRRLLTENPKLKETDLCSTEL